MYIVMNVSHPLLKSTWYKFRKFPHIFWISRPLCSTMSPCLAKILSKAENFSFGSDFRSILPIFKEKPSKMQKRPYTWIGMKTTSFQNMPKHDTQCSIVYWIFNNIINCSKIKWKVAKTNLMAMKKWAYIQNQTSQK